MARHHKVLYSLRIFCKQGQLPDVPWWRPQHVTLNGDSRFPLQGCMQAEDPESWHRYADLDDAPPGLTEIIPPQGMKRKVPRKPCPRSAKARPASSSSGVWDPPATLPKAEAGGHFRLPLPAFSKGRPTHNPAEIYPLRGEPAGSRSAPYERPERSALHDALGRGLTRPPSRIDGTGQWVPDVAPHVLAIAASAHNLPVPEDTSDESECL